MGQVNTRIQILQRVRLAGEGNCAAVFEVESLFGWLWLP